MVLIALGSNRAGVWVWARDIEHERQEFTRQRAEFDARLDEQARQFEARFKEQTLQAQIREQQQRADFEALRIEDRRNIEYYRDIVFQVLPQAEGAVQAGEELANELTRRNSRRRPTR